MAKTETNNDTPSFKGKRGLRLMGLNFNTDGIVKGFFGGNAYLAIIALLFICLFLLKSGLGFVPGYKVELSEARVSGVECTNLVRYELTGYKALLAKTNQAFIAEERHRFGDQKSAVYLYEEFEALVDDHFEDQVEEYVDLDDGPEKEAAAKQLREDIAKACAALPQDQLLKSITSRIPSITAISEEAKSLAISLAQEYALNDLETPDAVDEISSKIANDMGAFNASLQQIKKAGKPLQELEAFLTKHTGETDRILKLNRQTQESIIALEDGLQKARKRHAKLIAEEDVDSERHQKDADSLLKVQASEDKINAIEDRLNKSKNSFVELDTETLIAEVYTAIEGHDKLADTLISELKSAISSIPTGLQNEGAKQSVEETKKLVEEFAIIVEKQKENIAEWRHDKKVTLGTSLAAFFFGSEWQTGSPWQNVYGLTPLLSGSLLVAGFAILIAVPLAIGSAIYVNQFARPREAGLIKPTIEFIQAIPSVVLGLFGVLVLAGLLKDWSASPLLSWIPGFPITERLNILLAALLLAFMATPTIFTLAEDALNNVPKAYTEASLAMGATKLQTAIKVVVPASLSGIIAAVMLGFGRVVGETMVVLMVAGNKASIPDFSAGIGIVGQPVHTMTSIIAQEYGEVTEGSLHWQALFMVGLILFTISLIINSACQRVLSRNSK